ncbi:nucleotide-binding universal stress UspA family protein [Halohasta litchfieldiae]|jgi:nucleotide-binding universal stress UspA family protein|uniref:Nucleotide-binding universal stress protein, UspA family n=1 Tax=Halohasta litchfieldiae TaxID=1073996 RepID=A0A1H6VHK5_9EURY|nr:universal stress protein [Halohasta litchfieldiae]ATW87496.1 nucleotide-binding universal stress UspA family protein [Halohasta litchfieldiae]SEI99685.1 Nucleotide-binding universal stress protein, UspA family [Halohasta litchfieldiae]
MVVLAAISDADTDEQILAEAVKLADAFDDELHVVHVRSYDSLSDTEQDATDKTVKQQTKAIAAAAVEDVDRSVVPVGLIGQPAAEILEYAEEIDTRYLVIGGQKRSPVGKALFGSTTQKVLLGAERPVVTVMG